MHSAFAAGGRRSSLRSFQSRVSNKRYPTTTFNFTLKSTRTPSTTTTNRCFSNGLSIGKNGSSSTTNGLAVAFLGCSGVALAAAGYHHMTPTLSEASPVVDVEEKKTVDVMSDDTKETTTTTTTKENGLQNELKDVVFGLLFGSNNNSVESQHEQGEEVGMTENHNDGANGVKTVLRKDEPIASPSSSSKETTPETNNSTPEETPPSPKTNDHDTTTTNNSACQCEAPPPTSESEGPGKKVIVPLEEELVSSLPIMNLDDVRTHNGTDNKDTLLVTYDGIVYDVTLFAEEHPGGRDLLITAAGNDLDHFFSNYTVHGNTDKAANWLAPLAVGRLSKEDAKRAKALTTPEVHVVKRMGILKKARRKVLLVAVTLPFWMTVRSMVRVIGWFVPSLGRALAWVTPVAIPGYSRGAEQLLSENKKQEEGEYTVAVIGGGIAGCGAAWSLVQSGFKVTLFEAREQISGNARTFEWDFSPFRGGKEVVKSCVSVTAWPPTFYKNYTALLDTLGIETVHQPLSWFLNSKVPGAEGELWGADPSVYEGSLRQVFSKDFSIYKTVETLSRHTTNFFTLRWAPWRWNDTPSMYDTHTGLGLLNPLTTVPLYSLFKAFGGTDLWWDVIFTPYYTASFLVDELRPFPAVFGPLIEAQIPLNPNKSNTWQGKSKLSDTDCNITTCVTWKDAGKGIRQVFDLLVQKVDLRENTRVREVQILPNGKKRVHDEHDNYIDVDRVIFACPANAVGNIYKQHGVLEDVIFSTPVYADDHHPATGHMHAVMHSDGSVIDERVREECLARASNYVEVTRNKTDGAINIENQYNFGVQTPGPGVYDLPLDQKPVMLISHALGEGKQIDPELVRGVGNHARAHPLYSGWNVMAMLSLRLVQGKNGVYYCSNWTTPGNCHDMSLLSGFVCACAIGAKYPFKENVEAKKDFNRLRDLMGV